MGAAAAIHDVPRASRREPPFNAAAEASILGGVLLRNEVLDDLAELGTADFYDSKHRVVWEAIRNLQHAGRPIDTTTLAIEIRAQGKLDALGGEAFLGELVLSVPTADNVRAYSESVRLLARNRRAIIALSEALEEAWTWPHEPGELLTEVTGRLQRIEIGGKKPSETYRLFTIDDALDDLGAIASAPIYPTPFETLNEAMGFGGLLGSQIYTVAAGTGRGKTSWVAALAAHVAERPSIPVLISVHELGPGYFVARKAAGVLGTHSNEILRGQVDRALIHRAMPYPNMFFLKRPTLTGLRDATDHIAQKFGTPPLLIVDYLQKLADEIASKQQRPDLRLATSEASAALLDIGERTRAAIVAVSSIGRGKSALKSPRKFHPYELVEVAKESGAVEYDGAAMIVLTLSDEFEGDERVGTITLAKARYGREVHIDARYHGARGAWRDVGLVETEQKGSKAPSSPPVVEENREEHVRRAILAELNRCPAINKTGLLKRVTGCRKEVLRDVYDRLYVEGTIVKAGPGIALSEKGKQLVMEVIP